jgi:penicillin-binding protein 1C
MTTQGQVWNSFLLRVKHHRKKVFWYLPALLLGLWYWQSLPSKLFDESYSTVLEARNGELLSASIADDGQWRFPADSEVPGKFAEALTTFEDKRFFYHPGVDVISIARAVRQNMAAGKVVSGGSTLTMQVVRLSREDKARTFTSKILETILATRLEVRYSKKEILEMYAAHAPFGGNVVGLEAACWRYFNTGPKDLSWGQAALLAVLPNAPGLMHPGKNRSLLKEKRNRLLDKLVDAGKIDSFTCQLAKQEEVPEVPFTLPEHASHLLARMKSEGKKGQRIKSTIDASLQYRLEELLRLHNKRLRGNHINNGAAIILDVNSGNVLAYAGNIPGRDVPESYVDIIRAPRSTGSILKPFLYAAMLDDGRMLPRTLIPDVPVLINGFSPKNFTHAYDGAVHADRALIRSLNVPAVHMLREYRYEKFYSLLNDLGMSTLSQPSAHYGLSLILGGAEGTLWDITGMYASMGRVLNSYSNYPGKNRYRSSDIHPPMVLSEAESPDGFAVSESSVLSAASIFSTFQTLREVYRPGEETGWRYFSNSKTIAWKTGTSFGFRDAWSVGVTPEYAVGVWIGNADGEGRPGLTGSETAAPVMFDVFSQLPKGTQWFGQPATEMREVETCRQSGHRAGNYCTDKETVLVSLAGLKTEPCPYHRVAHLSKDMTHQVHDECEALSEVKHVNWFVLPPVQEFYFKTLHHEYRPLPRLRKDCVVPETQTVMDMIYPKNNTKVFIPRELDGSQGSSVFQLAHRDPSATVFWHLDGSFIGSTKSKHHLPMRPSPGKHTLTLVDEDGEELVRSFEILSTR